MQQSSIFWLRAWFFLLLLMFGWVFYVTAWVTEDAFITFRVIENLLNGYGPRWNIDERVQVFTHPLWMFLLVPIVAVCGDPYWAHWVERCMFDFVFGACVPFAGRHQFL